MRLRLLPRDGTCTFYKIVQGRKWIGRVYPHGDGHYVGRIGQHECSASTPERAFQEVGSRFMGHSSHFDLQRHNADMVQERRAQQVRLQPAKDAIRRGDYGAFFKELDKAIDRDMGR